MSPAEDLGKVDGRSGRGKFGRGEKDASAAWAGEWGETPFGSEPHNAAVACLPLAPDRVLP